ncbi:hypothetical protein C9374_010394 [Naegleria lovaniensis]|uniref:Uncharacterized protein n=1 Tax=Naegleria lovaniensis TaxID=51637 RepID=A0AA88GFU5_NAELO|nr:uncharacterized protein C9374_010394 [Naegleria lovaniensis]KAG2374817.1 hypothetical protein C9374_010394 [Naegleria lovaniensis]
MNLLLDIDRKHEQQLKERGGNLGYIFKTITTPTSQEVQKRFNCVSDQQRVLLLDTVLRFKFNVDLEKELFIRKDLDIVVDRFFSATLGDDENLTSSDINMNHASEDIKKLFHKFHPQSHDKRAALNVEKEACM